MAEGTEKCIEGETGRRKDWRRRSNKRERRRRTEDGGKKCREGRDGCLICKGRLWPEERKRVV